VILPVHDAVVIECDAEQVSRVAAEAVSLMADAVRKYCPALRPRIDVNAAATSCWNKDGRADSLDRFLADPLYKLG
jgi:hypothetical protein